MTSKTIAFVKHPLPVVWQTIRDRLPEIASLLDDIDNITLQSRRATRDGAVHLVHIWRANPRLPAAFVAQLKPEMLVWTDRSIWSWKRFQCSWKIEPHFFGERIKSEGTTLYEKAMGGRGTRVTFDSSLSISRVSTRGIPPILENAMFQGIESFLGAVIPKNFRRLIEATDILLNRESGN
jgi:hypothetical protein